ncbi:MAG: ribosome biogenesis GTPase Der [Anaerolineae bacterium]|jgi:GTP-binding protein|nr:ribosome biogenesis GTPase Der [Anaerolineae bacterium]
MRLPIVALVGRPNVGKSTLFNRLVGERKSIVEDEPGTTRDRVYAPAEWTNRPFLLIDTGGMDIAATDKAARKGDQPETLSLNSRDFVREIRQQAELAIEEADVVVFLTDAKDGLTEADRDVADILRRSSKPVVLAVNKADNESRRQAALEFYELSLGDPYPISALHGTGTGDLLDAIVELIPQATEEPEEDAVRIAIIGRPNVGKSSLLNALLQEERAIVSPIAGTTRDAVDTKLTWEGQKIVLIDTAGIRRRGKVESGIEKYSVLRAVNAIQRADVALLITDAQDGITAQDAHVAEFITEAYKSVAVIINKWDAVEDKDSNTINVHTDEVRQRMKFFDYVPVLFISALTRQRVSKVLPLAMSIAAQRNMRIPTSELNRILREAMVAHPAPSRRGKPLKFLYATQAETAPPTFIIFVNDKELVHFSYERFLENRIREVYPFTGTPIRLFFRSRDESRED